MASAHVPYYWSTINFIVNCLWLLRVANNVRPAVEFIIMNYMSYEFMTNDFNLAIINYSSNIAHNLHYINEIINLIFNFIRTFTFYEIIIN